MTSVHSSPAMASINFGRFLLGAVPTCRIRGRAEKKFFGVILNAGDGAFGMTQTLSARHPV